MTSYLTAEEIDALQTSGLRVDAPFMVRNVSDTQFSIARHYGGATIYGQSYIYHYPTDELVRQDVMRWIEARRKAAKRAAIAAEESTQRQLFADSE